MTRLNDANPQHTIQPNATSIANLLPPRAPSQASETTVKQTLNLNDARIHADRLTNDRLGSGEPRINPSTARLPTETEGEPLATQRGNPNLNGESWKAVFGNDGERTNRLMREIAVLQSTKENERGLSSQSSGLTSSSLPPGELKTNADGSITTPGGYTVLNDGNHTWRIKAPNGQEHRIWGDPHVDENNDGKDDWHFNRDASFILPDGTKIFCDTSKVGQHGGADVTLSDQLRIQYGTSLGSMDVRNGGPGTVTTDAAYDRRNGDGQLFVLADGGHFVDGASLGDLYDKGGDFVADVDVTSKGTISDLARITLASSQETGVPRTLRDYRELREKGAAGLPKLQTLSEGVQNVYAKTDVRKPSEADDDKESVIEKPKRGIQNIGAT